TGDEDDLPMLLQPSGKALPQHAQGVVSSDEPGLGGVRSRGLIRREPLAHPSDELVPSPGQGLDEKRVLRTVSQSTPDLENVALEDLRLNDGIGPQRFEQLSLRYQASGMLDEIAQHREGLRPQQNALGGAL